MSVISLEVLSEGREGPSHCFGSARVRGDLNSCELLWEWLESIRCLSNGNGLTYRFPTSVRAPVGKA